MKKFLQILGLSTILSLLFVQTGFAVEVETATSDATKLVLANLQNIMGVILSLMNFLIWPLLSMIGALMGNDLIFGPQVEDRLLLIWSQVRNLINLASVLVLIGIAIYNIFGVDNDGNYAIKKILPQFIIGLIVVNFTFFGAKVILSSVNVLTTAIYALPNSVETNFTQLDTNVLAQQNCPLLMDTYPQNSICLDDANFSAQAEQFFSTFSADNISFLMAMNLANISQMLDVSDLVRESPTIQNVTVNIIISLVLYFIYALSFVVLFIVLVTRVVVLWFVIALSPLILIQIVFPEGLKSITGDFDIQDLFIKHAFAPVIIGLGMTIGYLMLDAYQLNSAASLGSSLQLGEDFANAFSAGSSGLQELMVGLAAAAVVWKVTFAAAEGTLAGDIVGTIKGAVTGAASTVAGLPAYLQWIPTPGFTGGDGNSQVSFETLRRAGRQSLRDFEDRSVENIMPRNRETFMQHVRNPRPGNRQEDVRVYRSLRNVTEVRSDLTMGNFRSILDRMDTGNIGSQTARTALRRLIDSAPATSDAQKFQDYITNTNPTNATTILNEIDSITGATPYTTIDEASGPNASLVPPSNINGQNPLNPNPLAPILNEEPAALASVVAPPQLIGQNPANSQIPPDLLGTPGLVETSATEPTPVTNEITVAQEEQIIAEISPPIDPENPPSSEPISAEADNTYDA
jgi:hypothetical protein